MKAIEFEGQNIVIAKDQPGYQPLPAFFSGGFVVCCFKLEPDERKTVLRSKTANIDVLHFNGPLQGMELRTVKPPLPIPLNTPLNVNPVEWGPEYARLRFKFGKEEIDKLRETDLMWMIVAVRDSSLLPIAPKLS